MARRTAWLSSSVPCPADQEEDQGGQSGGRCRTAQARLLQQLFEAFEKEFNVEAALDTRCMPSMSRTRLTPARSSQGTTALLESSSACKSQLPHMLARGTRLRQSLAETSANPINTLHMLKWAKEWVV
jgi:hypothetical protein